MTYCHTCSLILLLSQFNVILIFFSILIRATLKGKNMLHMGAYSSFNSNPF